MEWAFLDDGDDEIGVLEIGDDLALVLVDCGVWLWRDAWGRVLAVPIVGEA